MQKGKSFARGKGGKRVRLEKHVLSRRRWRPVRVIVNRLLLVRVLIVKLALSLSLSRLMYRERLVGAAVYRTKFNRGWSKTYPFIVGVKADPFKFLCTICQRQIACEHQGKRDVERHIGKSMHQENAKSMKAQTTLKIHSESSALAEKVSLVVQLL